MAVLSGRPAGLGKERVLAVSLRGPDGLEAQEGQTHTAENPWLKVFMEMREQRKQLSHAADTAD